MKRPYYAAFFSVWLRDFEKITISRLTLIAQSIYTFIND
jgi:hypothetical protein